jgi:hypothetical protein
VLWKQRDGTSLDWTTVTLNFLNHFIFGIPIYRIAVIFLSRHDHDFLDVWRCLGAIAIPFVSDLYKYDHFYHRFKLRVPPVAPYAVTVVEYYLVAYALPFALASVLLQYDRPH